MTLAVTSSAPGCPSALRITSNLNLDYRKYRFFYLSIGKRPYLLTYLLILLISYLLTPHSRVLLENLTGPQSVKKFPTFHGTRRLITAFTSARQMSLSSASSIQSVPPQPFSSRFFLILSSHLCLGFPSGPYPSGFPPKHCIRISSPPYVLHTPLISLFSILSPEQYWVISTDY